MYGCFEVRFSFSIRRRIDHLNAHKSPHPLTADMDVVGGLHIVKPLVLCKLRADAVGRHVVFAGVTTVFIGGIDHIALSGLSTFMGISMAVLTEIIIVFLTVINKEKQVEQ